jgi:methionine synthase II (cobalamin-independent)
MNKNWSMTKNWSIIRWNDLSHDLQESQEAIIREWAEAKFEADVAKGLVDKEDREVEVEKLVQRRIADFWEEVSF